MSENEAAADVSISADFVAGLRMAAKLVHSDARYQTELAMRASTGSARQVKHKHAADCLAQVERTIVVFADAADNPAPDAPTPPPTGPLVEPAAVAEAGGGSDG